MFGVEGVYSLGRDKVIKRSTFHSKEKLPLGRLDFFGLENGVAEMKRFSCVSLVLVVLGIFAPAEATLWDRGGGLIYDDILNITWLQDASYYRTTGYTENYLTWSQATTWAENLEYYDNVRNVTYRDWRLPQTLPVNGSSYDYTHAFDGSTDRGYNISAPGSANPGSLGSEMAFLYYNSLGNLAHFNLSGAEPLPELKTSFVDGNGNFASFQNLLSDNYWSGTPAIPDNAWAFSFGYGWQAWGNNNDNMGTTSAAAWAVRPGDVVSTPVPEPTSILIFGMGVTVMGGYIRRRFGQS